MKELHCTNPREFFECALMEKTAPRNFNLDAETTNFLRLEVGRKIGSLNEIPRFITTFAKEILAEKKRKQWVPVNFPKSVMRARVSSGRFTYLAKV